MKQSSIGVAVMLSMIISCEGWAMNKNELPIIVAIAREEGLTREDTLMLLAIREAENGPKGYEYGVKAARGTDLETQARWCARSIKKNHERYQMFLQGGYQGSKRYVKYEDGIDFVEFMAYYGGPTGYGWAPMCPENSRWANNVRYRIDKFRKEAL